MIKELEYPYYSTATTARITWRAVFAGAFVCAALSGTFGLWGIGIGAIKVPGAARVMTFGGKAAVWLIITSAFSFGVGGWVAARLAGTGSVGDSVLHGLTAWAVSVVGLLVLFPTMALAFSPTGLSFAPTAARTAGWIGFIVSVADLCTACIGASYGTRLLKPVPVEEYERVRKHGAVTVGVGR